MYIYLLLIILFICTRIVSQNIFIKLYMCVLGSNLSRKSKKNMQTKNTIEWTAK